MSFYLHRRMPSSLNVVPSDAVALSTISHTHNSLHSTELLPRSARGVRRLPSPFYLEMGDARCTMHEECYVDICAWIAETYRTLQTRTMAHDPPPWPSLSPGAPTFPRFLPSRPYTSAGTPPRRGHGVRRFAGGVILPLPAYGDGDVLQG